MISYENTTIEACKAAAVLRMNEGGIKHKRRRKYKEPERERKIFI